MIPLVFLHKALPTRMPQLKLLEAPAGRPDSSACRARERAERVQAEGRSETPSDRLLLERRQNACGAAPPGRGLERQQCRAFEALKTRRILPKFGRLVNVPTVANMDVATCEDIPFLVRRVVREELVRLQAGDVHHQCSFAACPEPPPYWMRERHVENRPRTETVDFTPRLPFSPTGRGHHRMSSSQRAAADLRPSSISFYQKITMRHHKMFLRSTTRLRVLLPPLLLVMYADKSPLATHVVSQGIFSAYVPDGHLHRHVFRRIRLVCTKRLCRHVFRRTRLVCTKPGPLTRPTTVPDSNALTNAAASSPPPSEA
ncbi:hypothetical protein HPB51_007670 [Rhipicephalus microplus]|uniref:Uncharacterized protein n=1 Tax=Rhipicephalus microplus TaxID=6941 RepID=A0A9J6E828_RHIMP|nr:hypothetical protein HPB51_007670 [Rhipicephalus microplus]